ncbi:MAG: ribulose-phosphate 3-epimerase [Gaiellaceae bacterium]
MPSSERIRTIEVEPSIYGADFARLGEQLETLLRADCRLFHFDVGDGHFVEPITMGPIVLSSISPLVHSFGGMIDVHMMVDDPAKHFEAVAEAGGDSVTFHLEAVDDVATVAGAARERGLQVGLAFNPKSSPEQAAAVADAVDLVLCMAIHPGYSGQPFREETFERVGRLRELLPAETRIQVDGGVGSENIRELRDRGATLFVAASAIFGREDLPRAYRGLVQAAA